MISGTSSASLAGICQTRFVFRHFDSTGSSFVVEREWRKFFEARCRNETARRVQPK